MTNGKPTKGMRIRSVRMVHSRFEYVSPEVAEPLVHAIPDARREFRLVYDVDVLEPREEAATLIVSLGVVVRGTVADKEGKISGGSLWHIMSAYEGHFLLDEGADISKDDVLQVHGPAQLYAFAREFIADISRRAGLQPIVYLPPWNFTAKNDDHGTNA
jgi:preprotein translocase subunit SecB